MKLLNNKIAAVSLLLITVLLYIALSLVVKIPLDHINHNMWNGYYILALDNNAPVISIVKDLKEQGGWTVLSKYNSKIQVFSYNKKKSIRVSDLNDYYVKGDPLYDPFLQKLPLLFMGNSLSNNYQIVYIKSDLNPDAFSERIKVILGSCSCNWFLPEIKPGQEIIHFIFFAFAIIILFLWHRELWFILFPGILPWIQFVSGSGLPGVLASIIFIFSLTLLGSYLYKPFRHYLNLGIFAPIDKNKISLSFLVMISSFIYLLFVMDSPLSTAAFFIAVLATFSSVAFYVIILNYKRKLQQHRMFFPVRIKFQSRKLLRSELYIFTVFVLIIIISPLITHESRFSSDIRLPVPVAIEGVSDFSSVSMQILSRHSANSELPNLSDYISHMVFLQTYPYGFKYSFPNPDQRLTIPHFLKEGNRILEKNIDIYMFTDNWYKSIMSAGISTDVVSLLLGQDSPTLVSYRSSFGALLTTKYMKKHYWFSLFFILVFILWLSNMSLSGLNWFKEYHLRRKQEVV